MNPDFVSILLVTIVWMAMLVLINPIGNFPLNDDWAYGWTVKMLLETGEYQLSDWTATNLLSQVVWGAIFCLPFGFSFTVLRVSTLVLGLLGVLASYGLLRELTGNFQLALLGASVIALNPVYFSSSNSFNSDVPSFSFAILSLYFIVRGLRLNSNLEVLAGILISFIAILNRQSSIVITASFGLAYLAKKGLKIKNFTVAFLP
ncbi:MAG TPA: glycosyltransferase family 39 protein, partial [Phormidium sp.]